MTAIVPTTTATVGTPSIYKAYIPLVIAAAPPPTATPTSLPTPTSMPVPPTGTWLELINYYRGLAGSSSVTDDTVLNNNCFEHARYMAENNDLTHNQTPGLPWASPAGQICAEKGNAWLGGAFEVPVWQPQSSIDSWLGSLGHRLWLLYPTTPTFGFGFYAASNNRAAAGLDVLSRANFAADTTYTHWPVRYPASNQTDIPATSYSISLNWAYFGASPTNVSTTLMTAGGANIAHTTTTALPAGHKGIGITPTSALPAQTTILVTVNGSYEGVPFTYSWQFTTR